MRLITYATILIVLLNTMSGCRPAEQATVIASRPTTADCSVLESRAMAKIFADSASPRTLNKVAFSATPLARSTIEISSFSTVVAHRIDFSDSQMVVTYRKEEPFRAVRVWSPGHLLSLGLLLDCLGSPSAYSATYGISEAGGPNVIATIVWESQGAVWDERIEISHAQAEGIALNARIPLLNREKQIEMLRWAASGDLTSLLYHTILRAEDTMPSESEFRESNKVFFDTFRTWPDSIDELKITALY